MKDRVGTTTHWGVLTAMPMILCVLVLMTGTWTAGCAAPGRQTSNDSAASMLAARQAGASSEADSSARMAEAELDGELDPAAIDTLRAGPQRPVHDPGASMLATSIIRSLDERPALTGEPARVYVEVFRNQSHAQPKEVEQASSRLAWLLDRAGRTKDLRFTSDNDEAVDYRLHATAYLITVDGFDQWELYMRLTPADANWTVWDSQRPIRLLRQDRSGVPQVYVPPGLVAGSEYDG